MGRKKGFQQKVFMFNQEDIMRVKALKKELVIDTEVGVVRNLLKFYYDLKVKNRRSGL